MDGPGLVGRPFQTRKWVDLDTTSRQTDVSRVAATCLPRRWSSIEGLLRTAGL